MFPAVGICLCILQVSFFPLVHGTIYVCFQLLVYVCVFFLLDTIGVYIVYKRLNVLVCTNEFILSFLLLCSVLVYHGYTIANISPC